ncbi:hypothetical protein HQ393_00305 [Chitinibacter bivalviorum]|uniref:Uncharacterized protein n=1 Tax=Chitinibacter bivalviorum TaxID=2739434 RepID=A0A7H9BE10_9NEIS|nr:hypothetical protein [Chitinibacter bivalviorum]QLG86805.1 hypothetical protein HQ393_00305 [Chitinibacter bivalviorum]
MVQLDVCTNQQLKQVSKTTLSHEITSELQLCIELCAQLNIDFYDCLAHARIEYEKHLREGHH